MVRNSLGIAILVYVFLAVVAVKECAFLAPHIVAIWGVYGTWLLWFSLALVLNIFAAVYALMRRIALMNTGDKLAHLEKQLRDSETPSSELTEHILEHRR